MYEEWLQAGSIMELVNPEAPTFATGSALDKFLFVPGSYIPSTFLPRSAVTELTGRETEDCPYYPADVLLCTHMSDHHPIILPIPCDEVDHPARSSLKIRVSGLSEAEWEARDATLKSSLETAWPEETLTHPVVNINRLHRSIMTALDRTFYRERTQSRPPIPEDPLLVYLRRHAHHPEMDSLLEALEQRNMGEADRLMRRISADGWREFLKSVHRSDTRAFFAYLARAEGRKKRGFVPADSRPLKDPRGGLAISVRDKIALITASFGERFSAPAVVDRTLPLTDKNHVPLPPFRREVGESCAPVLISELRLALAHLASGKAPGPDGFPLEVFKRVPSLHPYLLALLNAMFKSGFIPGALRQIYVVSFPKPGKDASIPANRRPISLLNSLIKIAECVVYHRLLPTVEPLLSPAQYAYRRQRGTEHHLVELMDRVQRALLHGSLVYIVSFDIAGAFDRVSHHQLMQALPAFGVDSYTQRLIHNWSAGRSSILKLKTPTGTVYGSPTPISSGLPHGGCLITQSMAHVLQSNT